MSVDEDMGAAIRRQHLLSLKVTLSANRQLSHLAIHAGTGNFNHRRLRGEAHRARSSLDGFGYGGGGRLADRATFLANQKHHRVAAIVIMARKR